MKLNVVGLGLGLLLASGVSAAGITGTMPEHLLVSGSGRCYLLAPNGQIVWEQKKCGNIHRAFIQRGSVYYSNAALRKIDMATGRDELVYSPTPKEGVYGFELLANGNLVVAENSTDYIAELGADGNLVARFKGDPRATPGAKLDAHHHYRMIRKTRAGTYLVACSTQNIVKEYNAQGRLIWEQKVPSLAFEAIRRANGNTLVAHLSAVTEYTPDHRAVWSFACTDAPALKLKNLCGLQERANGNLVIGTYANGAPDGSRTTALEITREKTVVWSYAATEDRSMMTAFLVPQSAVPKKK